MGSQDLHAKVRDYQNLKPNEKRELMDMLRAMYVRSREIANMDQDAISPELIAEVSVGELVPKWVNTINPDKAKDIIASWDKSAPITKNKNSAHRYDAVVEGQGSIKEIVKRVDGKATEVQATEIHDSGKAQPVTTVSSQTKVPVNESYTADLVKLKVKNQMTTDSNPNVLRDYLDNGFDPNAIVFESDKEKWTALGLAAYFGAKEKVAMLLKYGADPAQLSRKGENNRTAIDWARSQNNSPNNGEVVRMIEEHMAKQSSASSAPPAKIQKKYDQAYTQNMINSMISGKMHVADTILPFKTMLDNGFDPNAYVFYTISEKWTALASAAYQGQIETVKLLLDHGADPLKRQMSKEISYDVIQLTKTSPNSPNKEEIIRLLQNQVDKIKTEAQNLTPIERARLKSYDEKYTAELSGYFDDKFRALDRVNFESFLKNGFNPNATIFNKHGEKWTAIGAAAWGGNINTVKILLEHGADPTVRCSTRYEDMDALGWAKDQGRTEVVKVLDEYYKKYNLQK
jgi:ankyrin repeat protein